MLRYAVIGTSDITRRFIASVPVFRTSTNRNRTTILSKDRLWNKSIEF